ncbi:MAG: hypothetical protein IT236_11015, partial [Bacteroidia bacterium]|nr:hypothetical protein [Bacteroidia bacterium]
MMKHIRLIAGVNFLILFSSMLLLSGLDSVENEVLFFIPVLVLTLANGLIGIISYKRGLKAQASSFILSALMVLIIGGSSCVTIKFKSKNKQAPKPKTETKSKAKKG